MDDTNPTMKYHYDAAAVAKYPSDAAYSAATGSALSVIGPRLRAGGALVIPNFGAWRRYRPTVSRWLKYVSGGMEEHFTKFGDSPASGYFTGVDWEDNLASLRETQAQGKLFLGIAHSTRGDRSAARYGWASMLLAADGRATFALHDDYTHETWFPEYGYDLGAPKGRATVARRRAPRALRPRPRDRQPDGGERGCASAAATAARAWRRAPHHHAPPQRADPAPRPALAPRAASAASSAARSTSVSAAARRRARAGARSPSRSVASSGASWSAGATWRSAAPRT